MDEKEPASVSSSRVDWLALQSVDRTQRAGHLTNLLLPTVEWTPGGGIDVRNLLIIILIFQEMSQVPTMDSRRSRQLRAGEEQWRHQQSHQWQRSVWFGEEF